MDMHKQICLSATRFELHIPALHNITGFLSINYFLNLILLSQMEIGEHGVIILLAVQVVEWDCKLGLGNAIIQLQPQEVVSVWEIMEM